MTRLDQDATGDQIAELLGRLPSARLVEQVYEKSRGNPYFSELLVRRGDLDSAELPDDLPDELSQALLDAWRAMSDPAWEIARILAIAGRPYRPADADGHRRGARPPPGRVGPRGRRRRCGRASAMTAPGSGTRCWPTSWPQTYLPGEAAPVHAAWAGHLESALRRRCRRAAPAGRPRVAP